jgi:hypothetical protein
VVEAPEVGGKIATLAHYIIAPPTGIGDFDNAGVLSTIVGRGTPTYAGADLNYQFDSGVMIQNSVRVSTPGDSDAPSRDATPLTEQPPTPGRLSNAWCRARHLTRRTRP